MKAFKIAILFILLAIAYSQEFTESQTNIENLTFLAVDPVKCDKHAQWVFENRYGNYKWKDYPINSNYDAKRWLSCFEPRTCDAFPRNNCEEFKQIDKNVCESHAKWVYDNRNTSNTKWNKYAIKSQLDAKRWLSCFEPETCSLFPGSYCDEFNKDIRPVNPPSAGIYNLKQTFRGEDFTSQFFIESGEDKTKGNIKYADITTALANKLISFPRNNGKIQFRTDIARNPQNGWRYAIRLSSKLVYNGGLFVIDADHFPEGKAVWPAFWLTGSNWPCDGEIDIIEYFNSFDANSSHNLSTLHTGKSCVQDGVPGISNGGNCGNGRESNTCVPCAGGRTQDCAYIGCGFSQGGATGGYSFNRSGGGVYAAEWIKDGAIRVWYLNKNSAEIYIGDRIDTSKWPKPYAEFKPCAGSFKDLRIIINTTLCGEGASPDFSNKGLGNCPQYVANPLNNFSEAYWLINYIKVYES